MSHSRETIVSRVQTKTQVHDGEGIGNVLLDPRVEIVERFLTQSALAGGEDVFPRDLQRVGVLLDELLIKLIYGRWDG